MTDVRIHCGEPMTEALFGPKDPTPQHRGQPIWSCRHCRAWEPRDGWRGELPEAWNGTGWNE